MSFFGVDLEAIGSRRMYIECGQLESRVDFPSFCRSLEIATFKDSKGACTMPQLTTRIRNQNGTVSVVIGRRSADR